MFFVGPDNGVFTLVAAEGTSVVALEETVYHRQTGPISATFHGRDVFAPVAAHLASGVSLEALGTRVDCWVRLPFPPFVSHGANRWSGEVLYLDHFGNGVTNLRVLETHGERMRLVPLGSPAPLPNLQMAANHICWRERELPLVRTYGDVAPGQTLALIGSQGLVEIAVCDGSAGASLGVQPGDPVWFISEC
jgi:hypothetical protein